MTDALEITPVSGPVRATIRPPGSKSITNRALVCAALAEGDSVLRGALDSEDTRVMIAALLQLGIGVEVGDDGRKLRVTGCGGRIPAKSADLFVANSGTTMRFLTPLVALGNGDFRLDGVERMRERPIGDLVHSLRQIGVFVDQPNHGFPPLVVHAEGLPGGNADISADTSSQFLSGLLLAAPYAKQPLALRVLGQIVSVPYIDMTVSVMREFGATVEVENGRRRMTVSNDRRYCGRSYSIEPDASAASYFFAAAAITGGVVTVEGLSRASLQGDVAFCDHLEQMGAHVEYGDNSITVSGGELRGAGHDMNSISDTVQTLAVTALFAEGPTQIRNVAHIRHKETDRIAATATELRKLGATVEELPDGLIIEPGKNLHGAEIDTYNDHRMAMSFALAGLKIPKVVIHDPGCTGKTYPDFFRDLARVTSG